MENNTCMTTTERWPVQQTPADDESDEVFAAVVAITGASAELLRWLDEEVFLQSNAEEKSATATGAVSEAWAQGRPRAFQPVPPTQQVPLGHAVHPGGFPEQALPSPTPPLPPVAYEARAIFLGNLHKSTNEQELRTLFGACGRIVRATIVRDFKTNTPRGFAYMEFANVSSVDAALSIHGHLLHSQRLRVARKRVYRVRGSQPVRERNNASTEARATATAPASPASTHRCVVS